MPEPEAEPEPTKYCLGCDYDLTGLPTHRCPECGRGFDPADGRTFRTNQPLSVWRRAVVWLLAPNSKASLGLFIELAILLIVGIIALLLYLGF